MNRHLAFAFALLALSLPQFASAASVNFGAKLEDDGGVDAGRAGGRAVDSGSATQLSGSMHWSGSAVTFDSGFVVGALAILDGKFTRTSDPALEGKTVRVYCNEVDGSVVVMVNETGQVFSGYGNVSIR